MDGFITEMEHARGVIGERTAAIRQAFAAEGVPATSLDPIGEVERWIDDRLPDLRRRSKLAHQTSNLPNWSPTGTTGLVAYQENHVLPPAEAQRLGRALAAKYQGMASNSRYPLFTNDHFGEIVNALAAHVNDPDYTAAFFAALGVEGTRELPMMLRQHLKSPEEALLTPKRQDEVIRTVSLALGTAVAAGSGVAGFTKVKDGLAKPENRHDEAGTGLLLSSGAFPAEWLAQIAVANGLREPRRANAGLLNALGNNPAAARLALGMVTDHDDAKLKKYIADLAARTGPNRGLAGDADAFGRLLAAASGAYDEKDGHHTKEAASFAFTVMTTMDDLKFGQETRVHLAEIAGAYATEITEGANFGDANHLLSSAFGDVKSRIPGLNPQFRLSPEDTYRYLKTFTDTVDNQIPFQAGMELLTADLISKNVPEMKKNQDPTKLDDVFAALGNVSGLQLAAQEVHGQIKDDAAEAADKVRSFLMGASMNLAGLTAIGEAIPLTWTLLSTAQSAADTFKPGEKTAMDKIRETDEQQTLARQHAIAQSLMSVGFTPTVSPHDYQASNPTGGIIADSKGHLRPFNDILKSGKEGLSTLDRWFIENGAGSDKRSLGDLSRLLADRFDGRKNYANARTSQFKH
ncbi:DUF6571 family protein [Sphaerisporangium flaviroseum]